MRWGVGLTVCIWLGGCQNAPRVEKAAAPTGRALPTRAAPHATPDCSQPSIVSRVEPSPPSLVARHVEGVYVFNVVVGLDGHAESVEVARAPNPSWAVQAAQAVRAWRWRPSICGGTPARASTTVRMRVEKPTGGSESGEAGGGRTRR